MQHCGHLGECALLWGGCRGGAQKGWEGPLPPPQASPMLKIAPWPDHSLLPLFVGNIRGLPNPSGHPPQPPPTVVRADAAAPLGSSTTPAGTYSLQSPTRTLKTTEIGNICTRTRTPEKRSGFWSHAFTQNQALYSMGL